MQKINAAAGQTRPRIIKLRAASFYVVAAPRLSTFKMRFSFDSIVEDLHNFKTVA